MKFTTDRVSIDFSELVNKKEIFIYAYAGSNHVTMVFQEKQIRELKAWLTVQIKKLDKVKKTESK